MGAYHSQPLAPKCAPRKENGGIKYAVSSLQGLRDEMQDAHAAILDLDGSGFTSFFGVYDGHGGAQVALYCSRQFHIELANDPEYDNNLRVALERVYFRIDEKLQQSDAWRELVSPPGKGNLIRFPKIDDCFVELLPWKHNLILDFSVVCLSLEFVLQVPYTGPLHEGTTACVALIRGNQIIVGNAGDSRCVLSRNGLAIDLSTDHKPNHQHERERIEAAGGQVVRTESGLYCINNEKISTSRAIGDFQYKQNKTSLPAEQMVTCNPDICTVDITNDTDFLLIASDGVWDVMTSQQAVDFVRQYMQSGETDLHVICESLLDSCVSSMDNSTVILVQFKGGAEIVGGQSSGRSGRCELRDRPSATHQPQ
nr:probable protein phosphatase 2C 21 [Lolium perenne]